jgi:hypothetical protein
MRCGLRPSGGSDTGGGGVIGVGEPPPRSAFSPVCGVGAVGEPPASRGPPAPLRSRAASPASSKATLRAQPLRPGSEAGLSCDVSRAFRAAGSPSGIHSGDENEGSDRRLRPAERPRGDVPSPKGCAEEPGVVPVLHRRDRSEGLGAVPVLHRRCSSGGATGALFWPGALRMGSRLRRAWESSSER